jgi:maltooligosyltrehalose trehalohydrolase
MQVREGRKKEFEAFYTGNTIPDPQSESTFLNSKLNRKLTDTNQTTMLTYYKELIRLRRLLIDTSRQGFSSVVVDDHDAILLHYKHGINAITAVLNFESEPLSVLTSDLGMPADVVLNSSASRWKGPGTQIVADQQNTLFPASSIVVMRKTG